MVIVGLSECKTHEALTPGETSSWSGPPECANSGPLLNGPWAALIATPPRAKMAGKEPIHAWAWQRVQEPGEKRVLFSNPSRLAEVGLPDHTAFLLILCKSKKSFLFLPRPDGGSCGGPSKCPAPTPHFLLTALRVMASCCGPCQGLGTWPP